MISVITSRSQQPLDNLLLAFVNRTGDPSLVQAMAKLILLLIGDAAMSSVLAFTYHKHILETCSAVRNNVNFHSQLQEMNNFGVELSETLYASTLHNFSKEFVQFVEYLVDEVVDVHSNNRETDPVSIIEQSYNPEKGTCYYFTPHGNQIRKQPKYLLDMATRNYDDLPGVDEACKKKYLNVSYGGYGYIFLWFCPIHGHCYGFHLIDGGEGRKDPFSSILKYLPTTPQDIFYDFACQYSEYCLNREPKYFLNTRFWHDLFHSITHKCGKYFKSSRICGLVGINSEICEQFSSYVQCTKYLGTHLSQSHFMFLYSFLYTCGIVTRLQSSTIYHTKIPIQNINSFLFKSTSF